MKFTTLVFFILMLTMGIYANAQTSKAWVSIPNTSNIPYYSTDSALVSDDAVFNNYINSLGIFSCRQALPASRNQELQQVYELECNCSFTELQSALTDHVSVIGRVERAPQYDTLHTPNDYQTVGGVNNYALNLINAQQAWDVTKGDTNVIVGICDQDYSATHSELVGKYVHLYQGGAIPTHGNAVSIIAAGNTNNNNGMSAIGYNCRLGLYGMSYNEMLSAAYAGIKVINMSWTSGCFYNPFEQLCVNEAYQAGAVLVAAAGNGNLCGGASAYLYPAAYDNVFAVTSVGPNDSHMHYPNDTINIHQHNDRVDLCAPGYDVAINPSEYWYFNSSGTSYAAPYVTGTIGLMLSANPCLSRKDIDTILRLSAVNIDAINPLFVGKLGAGRLDAHAAVQLATGWVTQSMAVTQQPATAYAAPGGTTQFTVASTSSFPLYQWQRDSSGTFVNLINNATYSGVYTNTLTISNALPAMNNMQYRCIMKSGYCQAISNAASLQVNTNVILPNPAGVINAPTIICLTDTIQLSINSVNNATGYNWTISGNSSIVSGQNTTSVMILVVDTSFSVTVTPVNSFGNGPSSTVSLSTGPFATASFAGGVSICLGDTASLTLHLTGNSPWTGMINGSIPFATATSPVTIAVSPLVTTNYILTELTAGSCPAFPDYFSTMATVTVLPPVFDTVNAVVCTSQLPYAWHGLSLNASGYYNDTIVISNGCDSIVTLHLTILGGNVPATPVSISQVLVSNQCNARIYRYTAAITPGANGYQWQIPGSCGGIGPVLVDSGDINSSRIIRLKYFSNSASFITDSIKVRAYNSCGPGPYKSVRLNNAALNVPSTPASITVTPLVTNICGQRKYRYVAPDLPVGNASTAAATGYVWSFTSPLPLFAQLDSGTLNSKIIVVKYISNNAAAPGDSLRLEYTSACGNSLRRSLKINIAALNTPAAPASVTITPIITNICGQRTYRLAMPTAPLPGANTASANGYFWTLTGNVALNCVVDSGSLNSRVLVIRYTAVSGTVVGDSVKAQYMSDCGAGGFRAQKFSVSSLTPPPTPSYITITALSPAVCGNRIYRYTAPPLPLGSTSMAAATGYDWSFTGALGLNATIDSGDINGQVIRVRYSSNAGAVTGDSVRVRYNSSCGYSNNKSTKLTNYLLAGCPPPTGKWMTNSNDPYLYPNPFTGEFHLFVGHHESLPARVDIFDQTGKCVERIRISSGAPIVAGKNLLPGVYWISITQSQKRIIIKAVKTN